MKIAGAMPAASRVAGDFAGHLQAATKAHAANDLIGTRLSLRAAAASAKGVKPEQMRAAVGHPELARKLEPVTSYLGGDKGQELSSLYENEKLQIESGSGS